MGHVHNLLHEREKQTSQLSDILLILVKAKFIRSEDIRGAASILAAVGDFGLPACDAYGLKTNRACGFPTCPNCEIGRRVRFGEHIGKILARYDRATLVHQRVTCDDLHGLSTNVAFTEPATFQFFARLDGLIALRISAGFDRQCRAWVLDRVAVTVGAVPRLSQPTRIRGITAHDSETYENSTNLSICERVGALAGFVEAATLLGANPLDIVDAACVDGLDYVPDSVHDAAARWKAQGIRHHLLRLIKPKRA